MRKKTKCTASAALNDTIQSRYIYKSYKSMIVNRIPLLMISLAEGSLVLVLLGELEMVTGSDMRYVYTVGDGEVFCTYILIYSSSLYKRSLQSIGINQILTFFNRSK